MRTGSWKRIACAACLSVVVAGAYRAASALPLHMQALPAPSAKPAPAEVPLVRGERLLTFGGYQLNVAFTPSGRFVCFDITTAPPAEPDQHSRA